MAGSPLRKILLSVDDSDECDAMVQWVVDNILRSTDEVHFAHVIPRLQLAQVYGSPPVDFMPQQNPEAYQELITKAEEMIAKRFLSKLKQNWPEPVVHIIKGEMDTDSIGHVLARKADDLDAALVGAGRHNKTRVQEFFIGSVASYLVHHCTKPVLITH